MKLRPPPGFLALVALALSPAVRAQDVSVSEPHWMSSDPAPDEMPRSRGKLRPDYPDDLRKTPETGYVIITRYIDAAGATLSLEATGTNPLFQQAVEEAFQDWGMTGAKSGGRGVNSETWMAAVFNPRATSPKEGDAIPRLLEVTPAFTPKRPTPEGQLPAVPVKFAISETGAVTSATPVVELPGKMLAAVEEAAKAWRFAPGRRNGQPVAGELTLPVICLPQLTSSRGRFVPAKPIVRSPPEYPFSMRRFNIEGEVRVDFVVTKDGTVQNAYIVSSNCPAFEEPAVKAVQKWKFEPATLKGKPVNSHVQVPIVFTLQGFGPTNQAFYIDDHADQSKLPPELRYDTLPKIRNVVIPVYPYGMRVAGRTGKATLGMLIGPDGRVHETKVVSADQPEFAQALAAAVEAFQFYPALKNGKPVQHLIRFEQEFTDTDLPDDEARGLIRMEEKHPEKIVLGIGKLDKPLKPISQRPPTRPAGNAYIDKEGEALIEFLVTEDGHVHLPRVVKATDPAFGYSAVQAVNSWWFEPPMMNRKKVVVKVQIPIKFTLHGPKKRD